MNIMPKALCRAFSSEIYAKEFVEHGRFRLGHINLYVQIEDKKRRDQTEGQSSSYVKSTIPQVTINKKNMKISKVEYEPGYLKVVGSSLDHLYLLCTSGEQVDLNLLRKCMGPSIVRINDPNALLRDIHNSNPINSKMEIIRKCKIEKILYSKGQIEDFDPNSFEAVKRSWIQKPPSFRKECEYRFIVTAKPLGNGSPDDFLFYELNRKLEYLDLI